MRVSQRDIEALEEQWRQVVANLNETHRNDVEKVYEQCVTDLSAKNDQVEQLSVDLLHKSDELVQVKAQGIGILWFQIVIVTFASIVYKISLLLCIRWHQNACVIVY